MRGLGSLLQSVACRVVATHQRQEHGTSQITNSKDVIRRKIEGKEYVVTPVSVEVDEGVVEITTPNPKIEWLPTKVSVSIV